ncbi:peptidoglycan DD-metalloendopeptidase family protein [Streptomyces smyrnaeus]|uniref:M23 family metallopeptidase n=1 Tax=Streptomyces smyrnaeus TaxID=1387713 RepID=UPI00368C0E6C
MYKIATAHDVSGGWKTVYDANRQVIGADPDLILPGQKLSLKAQAEAEKGGSDSGAEAQGSSDDGAEAQGGAEKSAPEPAAESESESAQGGHVRPVPGGTSTPYRAAGGSWSSGHHTGVDFSAASGTPVKSVAAGEVVTAGDGGAYGNQVVVRHADGKYTQYGHLSSLSVQVGQQVGAGTQLGLSGSTGNSTGPHLHFEVRTTPDYGSDVDPVAYLRAHGVSL